LNSQSGVLTKLDDEPEEVFGKSRSSSFKCFLRLAFIALGIQDEQVYSEFPIKKSVAYFNNASYTPMSSSTIKAIADSLVEYSNTGPADQKYYEMKTWGITAKEKLARKIGVQKENLVLTESATQAINMVANGFKFKKGDSLVIRGGATEHPSNFLPWKYYCSLKGVAIEDLFTDRLGFPDLSELHSAIKRSNASLVAMSHVTYNFGTILPVREIAKICHERGAQFFLDISQSVGSIDVNLEEIGCDFAAGTAAKWLCGPIGLGFLYCKTEALESLEPLNFGTNSCEYRLDGSFDISQTPQRLQEGFRNWTYARGLSEAIDLHQSYGMDNLRRKNLELADMIIDRILSQPRKYNFLGTKDDAIRTSIIPLESIEEKPSDVVARLSSHAVTIAEREIAEKEILRISPHFYNDSREIEKMCELL
jgi:cysteine desulfurase / selenocysteine lyase